MSTITWKTATNGNFATATNWAGNVAPGAADDALINAGPASYTVTSAADVAVANIGVAANVTLDLTGGTFTFTNGTDPIGLAGTVEVENGSTFSLGSTTANSGDIVVNGGTSATELLLNTLLVTLNGGGTVQLSDSTSNVITGAASNYQLENVDNVISGAGDIGNAKMVLTNDHSGVIDANLATPLIVDTAGNTVTNLGTMEATNGGTLIIDSVVTNAAGTIKAVGAGSEVILNAAVNGGTVVTSGGGTILFNNINFSLDGRGTHPITNASNLQIANGHAIYLYGVINNTGTIGLNSTGSNTDMLAASGFVTLQGKGKVVLSNSITNRIYGTNGNFTLTNVNNTISGAGQIGYDWNTLHFVNGGTVNANQSTPLQIFANSDYATNTGLLESTYTGGLSIYGTTIINQGGTVFASGSGSHVDIVGNSNIQGGTLNTASGGVIQTVGGNTGNLDGISFGAVTNNGTLVINENSTLNIAGSIVNKGTINLNQQSPNSNNSVLLVTYPTATLSGGGQVVMSDNFRNEIYANNALNTLINVDNTISGTGQIGANGNLTLVNQAAGVIDANDLGTLQIYTYYAGAPVLNSGILESTNTTLLNGGLQINSTAVSNAGGTVQAIGNNSHVDLASGSIQGGTLITTGSGLIQTINDGGNSLDGATVGALTITAGSHVQVNDGNRVYLEGSIVNHGTLLESSSGTSTKIYINSPIVTLSGGGQVKLSDNGSNIIQVNGSSSNVLDNVDNTISGGGSLGNYSLTFINEASGVVNANAVTPLTLNTYYGAPPINRGLLEATGSGGLAIGVNGYGIAVANSGTVLAATGSHVDLASGTVQGGTVKTAGSGVIQTVAGNGGLDGSTGLGAVTIATGSQVKVNEATRLYLEGTIVNNGTLLESSTGTSNVTYIYANGGLVTLTGGGQVKLSNSANNVITANGNSSFTLDNVDNTISGAGQLGNYSLTFINEAGGVVNANLNTPLTLDTYYSAPAVNRGLLEGTAGGGLIIGVNGYSTAVDNTGTIQALGAGAHVDLASGTIVGGTITSNGGAAKTGGGVFKVVGGNGGLDGSSPVYGQVTNLGTVQVTDKTILYLNGAINNAGTIQLNATSTGSGSYTYTQISGNVTLTGGGAVVLSNKTDASISGGGSWSYANIIQATGSRNYTLDNVNNTISGAGLLGNSFMTFINEAGGIVSANAPAIVGSTGLLVLNTAGAPAAVNMGLMQATNTGGLGILNTRVVNNNGTIQALTNGSHVDLYNSTISGGTIKTSANGVGTIRAYNGSQLDGQSAGSITNAGTVVVQDQQSMYLQGTVNNTGRIFIDQLSATGSTHLYVNSQFVTLTGGGTVMLSNNAGNTITATSADYTLVNLDNTISGAGYLGDNMQISNTGKIIAGQSLGLTIDTTGQKLINNAGGLLQATGAGGLTLNDNIFLNSGTVQVNDGSTVTFNHNVYDANNETGELTGGVWNIIATTHGANMYITGPAITIDSANVMLSGTATELYSWNGSSNVPIETSLTGISSVGSLNIALGRSYTTTNAFSDSGKLLLGGGTFHAGSLAVGATGLVQGTGTVNDAVANAGLVKANAGGTLNVTGNVTGAGALQADAGATLGLNGTSNIAKTMLDNGTVTLGANDALNITGSVNPASAGLFILNNASLLEVAADTGANNKMSFIGTGKLAVDAVAQFGTNVGLGTYTGPKLLNFGVGDSVDLKDLVFAGATIDSYTAGTGLLQLHSGSAKATLAFDNATLGTGTFHLANDTHGDVLLTHS